MSIRNRARSPRSQVKFRGNSQGPTVTAPPALKPGQVRCPVCRNGTRLTVNGYLRAHHDLFGHDCYAKATGTT